MLDSLFPHGNILVFVAVFVLFLFGMVFGSCAKDGEYKSGFIPALTLLGLIMSFGLYHFIGTFAFQ